MKKQHTTRYFSLPGTTVIALLLSMLPQTSLLAQANSATLSIPPRELLAAMPGPLSGSKLSTSRAETDLGGAGVPVTTGVRTFEWKPPGSDQPVTISLTVVDFASQSATLDEFRKKLTVSAPSGAETEIIKLEGGLTGQLQSLSKEGMRFEAVGAKRLVLQLDMQPCTPEQAKVILDSFNLAALGRLEATTRSPRYSEKDGFQRIRIDEINPAVNLQTTLQFDTSEGEVTQEEPTP